MTISRRAALQALGVAGLSALLPRRLRAGEPREGGRPTKAILHDAVRCIGCRQCALGCAEEYGWEPALALSERPELTADNFTVVRRFEHAGEDVFRKVQCMHCLEPACVSACMLGAMHKDEDGAVVWNGDLCVGCRYCEIACPYNVPRFEWDTATPELHKCQMCPALRSDDLVPACVAQCWRGALIFGDRDEVLAEAHRRIDANPERYNPKVFGERDGGGTSVLYITKAGVSFAELGLPDGLGDEPVPSLPEKIQHTLYRGFVAPLALFAVLGAVVRRNARKMREEEAVHHTTERAEPVGGSLVTPVTTFLAALAAIGVLAVFWRFTRGLGAVTNLNDGYAMGLWIAFDVVTGTALACGGYAMALLVYVANRGRYHPLVRPALVTSALGYTLGGTSVLIDIGRAWNFYKIPLWFWHWNVNSILLEVALCIMLYTMVLWIEVSPAVLEGWRHSSLPALRRVAEVVTPKIERVLPVFIALGMLLPTMHQSSLGSLMLLAGQKLHPLWHTGLLPLLFLLSCVAMGYGVVTLESCISAKAFRRPAETPMLRGLAVPIAIVIGLYVAVRTFDVVHRGQVGLVTRMDGYGLLFLAEMALFVVPAVGLLVRRRTAGPGWLMAMATMILLAGALYRFSTYLFAFNPNVGLRSWSYFPSVGEFAVTFGLVSAEILVYIVLVKLFPILRGAPAEIPSVPRPSPAPTDVDDARETVHVTA